MTKQHMITKVLEIIVNDTLTLNVYVNYIYKKASIYVFSIIILNLSGVRPSELFRITTTTIRPVLEYAPASWSDRGTLIRECTENC